MDSLLHTLRIQTRRLAGVLAFVFTLSSLLAMTPAHAKSEVPSHDHAMHMSMMAHHPGHTSPNISAPPSHHHGSSACCLGALNCVHACDHSLIAYGVIANVSGAAGFPLAHDPSAAVTRSIQPPRRPPKI